MLPETLREARWRLRGTRHLLPYWLAVARRASLDEQIQKLPRYMARELRWVEVAEIGLMTDVRHWRHSTDGFAVAGDWDLVHVERRPSIFEEATGDTVKDTIHNTVRALFLNDQDFRSTGQYTCMTRAVREGRYDMSYGCRSVEEVDAYFFRLIGAYAAMEKGGYLTQKSLGGPMGDEIKLYVNRRGEWCLGNGGNHRIRLAEVLGMSSVPVLLAGAHTSFVYRSSVDRNRSPRAAMLSWFREQSKTSQ